MPRFTAHPFAWDTTEGRGELDILVLADRRLSISSGTLSAEEKRLVGMVNISPQEVKGEYDGNANLLFDSGTGGVGLRVRDFEKALGKRLVWTDLS